MGDVIKFDYYYGIEAEQFSFYRVPRLLIKDNRFKGLSSDAKLLYGLMLDRMSLSMKNGWLDGENRAYIIYTIDNIMEDLGCGKDKAIKVLAELDTNKGIGLVERIRRGLGKPDIIYVKNFIIVEENGENLGNSQGVEDADLQRSEKTTSRSGNTRIQEVGKADFKESEIPTLRSGEIRLQEVGESDPNYTNYNNTDLSQTNPIYQSSDDGMDGTDEVLAYMELIKENLEYDYHMKYDSSNDRELFEDIYNLVCDVVCVKRKKIRIGGEDYPYELVKSRFLKLNHSHIEYVRGRLQETTTKITNIRAYLLTTLYNAPATISHFYQQEVQHDMYGGG
ncbi:MAG: replication initiator protein A [Lachnospiraceae bacterium]|nr:replication initiator protein A [Lachnospiraceae bacterium]